MPATNVNYLSALDATRQGRWLHPTVKTVSSCTSYQQRVHHHLDKAQCWIECLFKGGGRYSMEADNVNAVYKPCCVDWISCIKNNTNQSAHALSCLYYYKSAHQNTRTPSSVYFRLLLPIIDAVACQVHHMLQLHIGFPCQVMSVWELWVLAGK